MLSFLTVSTYISPKTRSNSWLLWTCALPFSAPLKCCGKGLNSQLLYTTRLHTDGLAPPWLYPNGVLRTFIPGKYDQFRQTSKMLCSEALINPRVTIFQSSFRTQHNHSQSGRWSLEDGHEPSLIENPLVPQLGIISTAKYSSRPPVHLVLWEQCDAFISQTDDNW